MDGFAVVAEDTFGASEEAPRVVSLIDEHIHTGIVPGTAIHSGEAAAIATGGMMPRGADAVVMVEYADARWGVLRIARAVTAGSGVSFAGTDITAGETVLRQGQLLTSRDTGVLAAIGVAEIDVWRKPVVAILSTGDEIIPPGDPMQPARVYDSNAQVLADAVREAGGEPARLGHRSGRCDDAARAAAPGTRVRRTSCCCPAGRARALATCPTASSPSSTTPASSRTASLSSQESRFVSPPPAAARSSSCQASRRRRSSPSTNSSRRWFACWPAATPRNARLFQRELAVKVNSEIGRTEYLLVGLVEIRRHAVGSGFSRIQRSLAAYPMGQGSGSVTTFSRADGFATIDRHQEIVDAGTVVDVQLLGRELQLADLVVIGSHCIGLDYLLGELQRHGVRSKFLAVGSVGGLDAARRGECDIAGVHLLDPATGEYNRPFLTAATRARSRLRPPAGNRVSATVTRDSKGAPPPRRLPA